MTPAETQRHELRTALSDVLAEAQVRTLMESLPPMGWQELATKAAWRRWRSARASGSTCPEPTWALSSMLALRP